MSYTNWLSASETERLVFVVEEMGETIQAIGKVLRHGYASVNPDYTEGPDNRQRLTSELGDVVACIYLLEKAGDIKMDDLVAGSNVKLGRLRQYSHHQEGLL